MGTQFDISALSGPEEQSDNALAHDLRAQAQRCLRLAGSITDEQTRDTLKLMAREYEEQAVNLRC